jgi:hypothetical protein
MTESQWLASRSPKKMLDWLHRQGKDLSGPESPPSERKMRLFACACVRQYWRLLPDERSRTAVDVAERFADGEATARQRDEAFDAGRRAFEASSHELGPAYNQKAAEADAYMCCQTDVIRMLGNLTSDPPGMPRLPQANLLREVVGNPFRPVVVAPEWLTQDVGMIARSSYEERDFGRLPILADALVDAGCADDALLAHLRSAGPHLRGCWALDLVLGRS